MIDTIKIFTMIDKNTFNKINNISIVKSSVNRRTGELIYELNSSKIVGSYSNTINIRIGDGAVYGFVGYKYISIEGSYHKLLNGYNSHNGYYNLIEIVNFFISAVNYDFKVNLPDVSHWFLQRIDIACVFDLSDNQKVKDYINNLSFCNYPRRNIKHFQDESIYCSGTSTTLKIYNKMLEFKKHDMRNLFNYNFNIENYLNIIKGFIRFECEIKKKKLESIYKKKYIRIKNVNYQDLKKVWSDEFMKLLSYFKEDLKVVREKKDIEKRLFSMYGSVKGRNIYNFYTSIMVDGLKNVKNRTTRTTFYRYIKCLKDANVDYSQKYKVTLENKIIDFNPFDWEEVS